MPLNESLKPLTFKVTFHSSLGPAPPLPCPGHGFTSGEQGYLARFRAQSPVLGTQPARHTHLQALGVHHIPVDPKDPLLSTPWPPQHPSSVAQGLQALPLLWASGQPGVGHPFGSFTLNPCNTPLGRQQAEAWDMLCLGLECSRVEQSADPWPRGPLTWRSLESLSCQA